MTSCYILGGKVFLQGISALKVLLHKRLANEMTLYHIGYFLSSYFVSKQSNLYLQKVILLQLWREVFSPNVNYSLLFYGQEFCNNTVRWNHCKSTKNWLFFNELLTILMINLT